MSYHLFPISSIRYAEKHALNPHMLMAEAAESAAQKIQELITFPDRPAMIFVGPGGNGGDALICGYHLSKYFIKITIVMPIVNQSWQKADISPECKAWIGSLSYLEAPPEKISTDTIIIDGLLGTGAQKRMDAKIFASIEYIVKCSEKNTIISLDIPSGLNADNGQLLTDKAVPADITLTFIAKKPGLFTGYGKEHAGIVQTIALKNCTLTSPSGTINNPELWPDLLRRKNHNTHKGIYGNVLIVGGSHGMAGAAILAARSATQSGAGKTYLYLAGEQSLFFDPLYPEILIYNDRKKFFSQDMWLENMTATVIGPGLGLITYEATPLMKHLMNTPAPLILDADALNLISHDKKLGQCVKERSFDTILTPHVGEMARLLNKSRSEIQANPILATQTLAKNYHAYVLLKGSGSIICSPDGEHYFINPTGHPNMAIAGMGDILSGMIASTVASHRHTTILDSLLFSVYLHGYIGDWLALKGYSHTLNSTVFLFHIPHAIDRLKQET